MIENEQKNIFVSAVIAAAGASNRMGGGDKQSLVLEGKTVLERSVEAFQNCEVIDEIIISAREDAIDEINTLVKEKGFTKVKAVCAGGVTRQQSVQNAASQCSENTGLIAIHDGARPLVTDEIIRNTVIAAATYGAASCAVRVKDTIKISSDDGFILSTPDRRKLWAVQTPQVFDYALYMSALKNASPFVTDDCQIVEAAGQEVKLIGGDYTNVKITTPDDITYATAILKERENNA